MSDIAVVCIGDGLVQPALSSLPCIPQGMEASWPGRAIDTDRSLIVTLMMERYGEECVGGWIDTESLLRRTHPLQEEGDDGGQSEVPCNHVDQGEHEHIHQEQVKLFTIK